MLVPIKIYSEVDNSIPKKKKTMEKERVYPYSIFFFRRQATFRPT